MRAFVNLDELCLTCMHNRRLIGRPFDDPIVKKDVESWPFKVVAQGTAPAVEVEYLGETKTFTPQEISSMVLRSEECVRLTVLA